MSTNKTTNYGLHAWTAGDDFRLHEINENFAALDRAPRMAIGSYAGTGQYGSATPNVLTFDFSPTLVIVQGGDFVCLFMRGSRVGQTLCYNGVGVNQNAAWGERSLSWYAKKHYVGENASSYTSLSGTSQLNRDGTTYFYIALG